MSQPQKKRRGRKRKRRRRKNPTEGLLMGRGLHKETRKLIDYIKENILTKPKSIRRIYYALEAVQMIESSDESYQKIVSAMKMARFHGLIHPEMFLLDKARKSSSYLKDTYKALNIFQLLHWNPYYINYWDVSDFYLEVWQEKEGMEQEFLPLTKEYNVRLETGRGYQSIRSIWNAMKRFEPFLLDDKKIKILYFGDFNPAGFHAVTHIQNTIAKLWNSWQNEFKADFSNIEFKRIGLNLEHLEKYNLPENPTKKKTHKDRVIAEEFIKQYGDRNVEMESLAEREPEIFTEIIQTALQKAFSEELLEERRKAEHRTTVGKRRIEEIIKEMMKLYYKEKWNQNIPEILKKYHRE